MECFKSLLIIVFAMNLITSCSVFAPQLLHRENYLNDKENATAKIRILIKKDGENLPATADYKLHLYIVLYAIKPEIVNFRRPSLTYEGKVDLDEEIIFYVKPGEYGLGGNIDYWENMPGILNFGKGFFGIRSENYSNLRIESGQTLSFVYKVSTTGDLNSANSFILVLIPPFVNLFLNSGILAYDRKIRIVEEASNLEK